MKILFKNSTKYTRERYDAFNEFHKNKYGKKIIFKSIMLLICAIYILIFNIIIKNWLFLLTIAIILIILFYISNRKENDRKKRINKLNKFTFYFYPRHIKIKCGRKFDRIKYFQLYKVFETKDYFFLYTDEKHSLIISKEGFEIGTARGFSTFIKKKCLLKYRKED